jgi:hypothetical protein
MNINIKLFNLLYYYSSIILTISILIWLYFFFNLSKIRDNCIVLKGRDSGYRFLLYRNIDKETLKEKHVKWYDFNITIGILPPSFFTLSSLNQRIELSKSILFRHYWVVFIIIALILKLFV